MDNLSKQLASYDKMLKNINNRMDNFSIGMMDFLEALCDFDSSINIMPRVLYEKFFIYPLLETTMYL